MSINPPVQFAGVTAGELVKVMLVGDVMFGGELICVPVVRRGTALPVTKAEPFHTGVDGQERVHVEIFQGDIVQFRIDLSGLPTTTATEKRTGLAKSVTIDTVGQHRINLDTARGNLAALFDDEDEEDEDFDGEEAEIVDRGDGRGTDRAAGFGH